MFRCKKNPLIEAKDVKSSRPDFHVDGIFNCGACRFQKQILLVCRIAESAGSSQHIVKIPVLKIGENTSKIDVLSIVREEHPDLDFSDRRTIVKRIDGRRKVAYLTSFSHLRIARSNDGIHFTVDDKPMVLPETAEESWGMEDPRITEIGKNYYINYTAVSQEGPATGLMKTQDFQHFERLGIIFAPENKDVAIFPGKINGLYYALNRPASAEFAMPKMWICESPDLVHWGRQHPLYSGLNSEWDNTKIGGGAVPFLTRKGWIEIYHAVDYNSHYCLGAMLLDRDNPRKILARTRKPILRPETKYEKQGFFGNTVFTCGCIPSGDKVIVYYGAADDKICRADYTLDEIFQALEP